LQTAAKPLQTATWLLFTAYKNLTTLYPTVPSNGLATVNNLTDRRTTHRTISANVSADGQK